MKRSTTYRRAAKLVHSGTYEYSCNAIDAVAGYVGDRQDYIEMYNLFNDSPESSMLGLKTTKAKAKEHRIWMLLLAAAIDEAEGD